MFGKISACIFLLVVLQKTCAQTSSNVCAKYKMLNEAGYENHPTDCDKYIQCELNMNGDLEGTVRQCAFSTYWNLTLLTCQSAKEYSCPHDKCANRQDGDLYDAAGNCRGFWQCKGGKSEANCCPNGQQFDRMKGCVNDTYEECSDKCFNDEVMETVKIVCPPDIKSGPLNMPHTYSQFVPGWGWIIRPCGRGAEFSQDTCSCEHKKNKPIENKCKAELHLPFTNDFRDEFGKNHVIAENIEIINGRAIFDGQKSRIIIPRFNNLESKTVVIKVNYSSNHLFSQLEHAIVSNDCGNVPSILISENANDIHFGVGTSQFQYTSVKQRYIDPFEALKAADTGVAKSIVYTFDGEELRGSNGINTNEITATGRHRGVPCDLQIGFAERMSPFKGSIDDISIFLCNPDKS